jgi:hypothetical protein
VIASYFRIAALLFWGVVEGNAMDRCDDGYWSCPCRKSSVYVVSFDYVMLMLASFVVCKVISAA